MQGESTKPNHEAKAQHQETEPNSADEKKVLDVLIDRGHQFHETGLEDIVQPTPHGLLVVAEPSNGLIKEWNSRHTHKRVRRNAIIVMVNGECDTARMQAQMYVSTMLRIKVQCSSGHVTSELVSSKDRAAKLAEIFLQEEEAQQESTSTAEGTGRSTDTLRSFISRHNLHEDSPGRHNLHGDSPDHCCSTVRPQHRNYSHKRGCLDLNEAVTEIQACSLWLRKRLTTT